MVRKITLIWILILMTVVGTGQVLAAGRTALVIGNGNYRSISSLENPVNDARDMKSALEALDFEVILRTDANRRQIREAVRVFGDKIKKGGVGLFYYAGHGVQIEGTNYIIPVGVDIQRQYEVEDQALKMTAILGAMEEAGNSLNILILDACRDNPFRSFRSTSKGLARMDAPRGSIIAYATAPGEKAEDGIGRNGTYTGQLLKNLKRPDLSVQEVLNQTGLDVMEKTRDQQVPWISSTPIKNYYLAGGSTVVDTPVATPPSSDMGSLAVTSTPTGADISIDGRSRGSAPVTVKSLKPGKYTVRADKSGYTAEQKTIRVNAGRKAMVSFILDQKNVKARLYVSTEPENARVRILNITPAYHDGIALDQGRYQIEVAKSGYETKQQWVEITGSQGVDLHVSLEKSSSRPVDPRAGEVWTEPTTGIQFVWVEGGCYQMGQTGSEEEYLIKKVGQEKYNKWYNDEHPRHRVCVGGFWMGKTEVTRGQFRKFITATGYRTDADKKGKAWIFNKDTEWKWKEKEGYNWAKPGFSQTDDHPVVTVSWNDAKAFIQWLNKQTGGRFTLPTEAQWEYAARGGTTGMRFWGEKESDACRYTNAADKGNGWNDSFPCDDGYEFTSRAGHFRPNAYGLYDMLGNVWEWCEDVYDKDAYKRHSENNPVITTGGSKRVLRGGSWFNFPRSVRSAKRGGNSPSNRNSGGGFRLLSPKSSR